MESKPKVAVELELTKVLSELPKALPQGSLVFCDVPLFADEGIGAAEKGSSPNGSGISSEVANGSLVVANGSAVPLKGSTGGVANGSSPLPNGSFPLANGSFPKSPPFRLEDAKGSSAMGAAAKGSFPEFEVPNGSAELVSVGSHAPPSFGISGGA